MTELLDRVLSVRMLRSVIRQKCRAGVGGQTVSWLIATYVTVDAVAQAHQASGRLPVELIRPDRRTAFLAALHRLPVSHSRS